MSYTLVYTARAARDIQSLDVLTQRRLAQRILGLQENPRGKARKLSDPRIGTYRIRIGDYRVVFDIEGSKVVILRVGHRREIYR